MTTKEYIDEIMLRLSRLDNIKELNELIILTYLNKGRQQAQRFTIEAIPERYSRISVFPISPTPVAAYTVTSYAGKVTRMYPVALPNDFIDVYRVLFKYNRAETGSVVNIDLLEEIYTVPLEDRGSSYTVISGSVYYPSPIGTLYTVGQTFTPDLTNGWDIFSMGSSTISKVGGSIVLGAQREVEVRHYTLEELYNTNVLAINPPMIFSPIYVVVANNDNNYRLLIAGLDITSNMSIFEDDTYANLSVEVWYTVAIDELELRNSANAIDNELTIPIHLEELAINYAMLHCLRHINHQAGVELLMKEVRLLESLFTQNYEQNITTKGIDLATNEG